MNRPEVGDMVFAIDAEHQDEPNSAVGELLATGERFTAALRNEIGDIIAARDEILAAAREQAAEFQQEAAEEIEAMLGEARARADRIVADAEAKAAATVEKAHAESEHLAVMNARYRASLHTALQTLEHLPKP